MSLNAHTLHVEFSSLRNPHQPYHGILDMFASDTFTVSCDSSPAVGNLVNFSVKYDAKEMLRGTAKIHSVTSLQENHIQVDFKVSQAEAQSLQSLEALFNERQNNILEWISSFRED